MNPLKAVYPLVALCLLAACTPETDRNDLTTGPIDPATADGAGGPVYVDGETSTLTMAPTPATVAAPGGGDVPLLSKPSVQSGRLVARIPDGAAVETFERTPFITMVGTVEGEWCEVRYQGTVGWVFDPSLAPILIVPQPSHEPTAP